MATRKVKNTKAVESRESRVCRKQKLLTPELSSFGQLNRLRYFGFLQIRLDHEQSLVCRTLPEKLRQGGDSLGKFYGQAERAISTGQLHVLLRFHLRLSRS